MALLNQPTKLYWIDMEMTGLDVNKEVPIEVAVIVTDFDFKVLDTYEAIIKQPQKYLDNMDAWNKEHHGKSGLTAKVPNGTPPDHVEAQLMDLVKKHFPNDKPILAGNSIFQDRIFIDKYFSEFSKALHYRMVDVSSFKVIMQAKYGIKYDKANQHRALDDIRESIGELKHYLGKFKL